MRASTVVVATLSIALNASTVWSMFASPTDVPADRLVKNATAYVNEHPDDAAGYYTLARIHYLAFANKSFEVGVFSVPNGSLPRVAPDWLLNYHARMKLHWRAMKLVEKELGYSPFGDITEDKRKQFWAQESKKAEELEKQDSQAPKPTDEELNAHAAAAARNFKKAIALWPQNALYHLGLASLLEQYVDFLKETEKIPQEFRSIIREKATETYYTAYSLAIEVDLQREELPTSGLESLVGHEAGKGFLRLSDANDRPAASQTHQRAEVAENMEKLQKLPPGGITPIIFSFNEHASLAELLAPEVHATFDLDGDGVIETWPWVKPTTGILVWDPARTGRITSGRQLFGSVTWWLFFSDGYRALDALDDNRDGKLADGELAGISAWFDRNSNGRTDEREVVTLKELRIASVATGAASRDGNCLMNENGLTFHDGRTVPTYDWVAFPTPVPDRASQP